MSTTVKIVTHCDVCGGPAVRSVQYRQVDPATDPPEFVKPDSQLDLCTEHHAQFLTLHQHALPYLPPIDRPPLSGRGRPTEPCPVCGQPFTVGSGMALHRKHAHPSQPNPNLKAVTT